MYSHTFDDIIISINQPIYEVAIPSISSCMAYIYIKSYIYPVFAEPPVFVGKIGPFPIECLGSGRWMKLTKIHPEPIPFDQATLHSLVPEHEHWLPYIEKHRWGRKYTHPNVKQGSTKFSRFFKSSRDLRLDRT